MTRLRTSRPMSSVPKGWARLGADSRISGWGASGSYGATTSANVAVSASSTMIPADATPSGLRLSAVTSSPSQPWPSATGSPANVEVRAMAKGGSVVPDARIEPRVHEVDHEVEAHQRAGHEHDVGLHDGIIPEQNRLDGQAAHPGQREDRFDDHRSGQQRPELPAHDGDDGNERVLERVLVDDDPTAQALGPRGAHVVLAQHLEDGGARHAHGGRRQAEAEHRRRQQELLQVSRRRVPEADVADGRDPAEPDGGE